MTLKYDVRYFDSSGFDDFGRPPQIVAFGFATGVTYASFSDLMWVSDLVRDATLDTNYDFQI